MANCSNPVSPVCTFPETCDTDWNKIYCCLDGSNAFVKPGGLGECMTFPTTNDDGQPMLKTPLSGIRSAPFVKIGFLSYDEGGKEDASGTAGTIITMGNESQPCNKELCRAAIKAFQYGWGTTNQGNVCKITIVDEKGSQFEEWVRRLVKNLEAASTPVKGAYRMVVQWGWYISGGNEGDECGDITATPGDPESIGSSAHIFCSPKLYFLPNAVNVHWEDGKFIYNLEGVDLLYRGQSQNIIKVFGNDDNQMYFTKAVELLGKVSFPPFRVAFKAFDDGGQVTTMEFQPRDGNNEDRTSFEEGKADCSGYGPKDIWRPMERPPLTVIQEWITAKNVLAKDLTGRTESGVLGITMNYDSTSLAANDTEDEKKCRPTGLPDRGLLILWAKPLPGCEGEFSDGELYQRMKAVYMVNGGNCSPVISFNPAFKWNFEIGLKSGGAITPVQGTGRAAKQTAGAVRAQCPITADRGSVNNQAPAETDLAGTMNDPQTATQAGVVHQLVANTLVTSIEAELRVQGDPSAWLCSPLEGCGRCVGIVFINPYFLIPGEGDTDCPVWDATDEGSTSICNTTLTNRSWWVRGVDHQIQDGQYVTTIKVFLPYPGGELVAGTEFLGGDPAGGRVDMAGKQAALDEEPVGDDAAEWDQFVFDEDCCCYIWVGGGAEGEEEEF